MITRTIPIILLVLLLLAACAGSDDQSEPSETVGEESPAPAASGTSTPNSTGQPGGAGGEIGPGTIVPAPGPPASPPPIPPDWPVFTNPNIVPFTFRYPASWFLGPGPNTVSSWDSTTWDKPWYPVDGFLLQFDVVTVDSAELRPPEATDVVVDGLPGWEIVRVYDLPATDPLTRTHQVSIELGVNRVYFVGIFAQETPDEDTFYQIISSLDFSKRSAGLPVASHAF